MIRHMDSILKFFVTACILTFAGTAQAQQARSRGIYKPEGISILGDSRNGYSLYVDGRKTYIKGVGGTNRLDIARENGANACRTWGGNVETIDRGLALARENGMYMMQGISLSKRAADYKDENYRNGILGFVREIALRYREDTTILVWGIGNEIELAGANGAEQWRFVNEISELLHSLDGRHLTSTVISHNPSALDSLAKYAPDLDLVGINSYGNIGVADEMVARSAYDGPYMITEWGPPGWWETAKTEWGAPIEQTSEEKRQVYEQRYTDYILGSKCCLGSFCFLWGQKEERTPTWFCMFVEDDVPGLPLSGEKTPMVEAMQRVWTGCEPRQTAPVVGGMTVAGRRGVESPRVEAMTPFNASVTVYDREGDVLTFVWENLREATVTASGGAYEPRPERVGEVVSTKDPSVTLPGLAPGEYRLYCYIFDGTGYVATANVPYQVK